MNLADFTAVVIAAVSGAALLVLAFAVIDWLRLRLTLRRGERP